MKNNFTEWSLFFPVILFLKVFYITGVCRISGESVYRFAWIEIVIMRKKIAPVIGSIENIFEDIFNGIE